MHAELRLGLSIHVSHGTVELPLAIRMGCSAPSGLLGGKEDCLAGYWSFVITKREDASRGLTREELLALPAAVDLETANRALSLSRTTGYDLAKRGRYPCTVLRLGNAYRVVTADLLKLLHIDVPEPAGTEVPTAATPKTAMGRPSSSCCCCCCAHRREECARGTCG